MNNDRAGYQKEFPSSVERGWFELSLGLGTVVTEDDMFFDSLKRELSDEKGKSA